MRGILLPRSSFEDSYIWIRDLTDKPLANNGGVMEFSISSNPTYLKYFIKDGELYLFVGEDFISPTGTITSTPTKFMDINEVVLYAGKTYSTPLGDVTFLSRYVYFYGGVREELQNISVPQDGVNVFELPSSEWSNYPFTNPVDATRGYFFRYSSVCGEDVGDCVEGYCVSDYGGESNFTCSSSLYPVGKIGPLGPRGDTGARGDEGKMGYQGEAGDRGAQGKSNTSWDPIFLGLFLLLTMFIVVGIFFLRPILGYPEFYFFRREEGSPLF